MIPDYVVSVENVSYRYPRSKKLALKNVSLQVKRGQFLAIMGENGSGKSTLCKVITGIIPKSEGGTLKGKVWVCGLDTAEHELSIITQKIGIVLEDPETQIFTTKVLNEVAFGAENLNRPPARIREMVEWALNTVRLTGYEERHPWNLSGGQKQRLAIAAALAMEPEVLVLDEPVSQLDPIGAREVFDVIRDLKEKQELTIIMVSHNSEEIAEFADVVGVLHQGEVISYGTPAEVFHDLEVTSKAWIRLPQVAELALKLRNNLGGLPAGKGSLPVTEEEGLAFLKQLAGRRRGMQYDQSCCGD